MSVSLKNDSLHERKGKNKQDLCELAFQTTTFSYEEDWTEWKDMREDNQEDESNLSVKRIEDTWKRAGSCKSERYSQKASPFHRTKNERDEKS